MEMLNIVFAIAVREHLYVVGHPPRELSKVMWYFLLHGGVVTGRRQHSPLNRDD